VRCEELAGVEQGKPALVRLGGVLGGHGGHRSGA
jgi:hypothetical protein